MTNPEFKLSFHLELYRFKTLSASIFGYCRPATLWLSRITGRAGRWLIRWGCRHLKCAGHIVFLITNYHSGG